MVLKLNEIAQYLQFMCLNKHMKWEKLRFFLTSFNRRFKRNLGSFYYIHLKYKQSNGLFWKKIGSFIGKAAKTIGQFGGAALSKIGAIKWGWDGKNGLTGGMLGKAVEGIPVIGGAWKAGGDLLKLTHGAKNVNDAVSNIGSNLISNGRKVYGASPPKTLKHRDTRRAHMGLENI